MRDRRRGLPGEGNVYETFSDMALLMLAAFVFLFALILITSRLQGQGAAPTDSGQARALKSELEQAKKEIARLKREMETMASADMQQQVERILASAGWDKGKGKRDFSLFVKGLKNLPGDSLHLVVDATGSMHGATTFLIPVLRVIAIRSGKKLTAVTWYADRRLGTFHGTMGEMFDLLMQRAPFVGADETIGYTFRRLAESGEVPSAYLLLGDEPPTDRINYHQIPAPVFTLPLGYSDTNTRVAFHELARQTGGRMLELKFK